ncbi:hypothetical protein Vadar_016427 [Vaccinium darrowii]|uniref:Uncharacterized protein n=1 Tax=Vaccinium darrowii TaxID=229202 RepID=A0ACB7Y7F5_9ERIC|nr:hypothetical protein Vadar_016427 [Vaccinium darrowii]
MVNRLFLGRKIEEANASLKAKDAKVIGLEYAQKSNESPKEETGSTIESQQEKYREVEAELEGSFKQKIEAEVKYLAISRTIPKVRVAAADQVAMGQPQIFNELRDAENKFGKEQRVELELPKYRDRAKERREDKNPDYEASELGSFHAVAPPGTVDLLSGFEIDSTVDIIVHRRVALDVLSFLGASCLLLCTYNGYTYEPIDDVLYAQLNGEINGSSRAEFVVSVTYIMKATNYTWEEEAEVMEDTTMERKGRKRCH